MFTGVMWVRLDTISGDPVRLRPLKDGRRGEQVLSSLNFLVIFLMTFDVLRSTFITFCLIVVYLVDQTHVFSFTYVFEITRYQTGKNSGHTINYLLLCIASTYYNLAMNTFMSAYIIQNYICILQFNTVP